MTGSARVVDFDQVPPLGSRVRYAGLHWELVAVTAYRRSDGLPSSLLWWRECAGDPLMFLSIRTSGLRGNSLSRVRLDAPPDGMPELDVLLGWKPDAATGGGPA